MIYVMIFFLFFQFFYLEIRKLSITYLAILMLVLTIIEGFFIGYNILLIASLLSINISVVYLAWLLQGGSYDKIKWNTLSYLTT